MGNTKAQYPHSEITDKIIQCAIEAHKILGPGFLENIYEKALILELKKIGLKASEQVAIPIVYKGTNIGEHRLDLLIEDKVIVENKTVADFNEIHMAQILSYLKATNKQVGLLLNFAKTTLDIKRVIK